MVKNALMCAATAFVIVGLGFDEASAQNHPVRITATKLTDHIFMYTSAAEHEANQVASVGDDGTLLVDAGWSETAPALRDELGRTGNRSIRILINTHGHGDHASGNRTFKHEAVILAHRNAYDQLTNRYFALPPISSLAAPHLLVDDSLTLRLNDEEIRLTHAPACHTSGDLIVHFVKSNIVCVGDLLFPDHFPYIDLSVGGNVVNYYANIKRLISAYSPETRFVSGHGRVYSVSDLVAYYDELEKQRDIVRRAVASGKPLATIQNDSVLNNWLAWSGPWVTTDANYWIAALYQSLSGDVTTPKTSICAPLTETLIQSGIAAAVTQYHTLKSAEASRYDFGENQLNLLGYHLLWRQMIAEAVAILRLNAEAYPNSSNVYDSYGEVLLVAGDTARAIENYKRSLELNSGNANAVQVLDRLKSK